MEPVRIKLYGLISITKRGYVIQLILGGLLLLVLLVMSSFAPQTLPPGAQQSSWWVRLLLWLLINLPWIILALVALYAIEAVIVFHRFARAEAEQRKGKSKK